MVDMFMLCSSKLLNHTAAVIRRKSSTTSWLFYCRLCEYYVRLSCGCIVGHSLMLHGREDRVQINKWLFDIGMKFRRTTCMEN